VYKVNNIVLAKSCASDAIPPVHLRLLKRHEVKPRKGNRIDWPGYVGWDAELVYKHEADMLRKEWSIPFKFPHDIKTFVFETDIIKKVRKVRKRK